MEKEIDYSIYYRRFHSGTVEELANLSNLYDQLLADQVKNYSKDSRVLDFGCGFGALVHYLKMHFYSVIGVDASEDQVSQGIANGLPISLLKIEDFNDWCINFHDYFDIIFLFDVLEHIPANDQIKFMRFLLGTLKKGGAIYIKVPNANSLLANIWRYGDWTHCSSFTESSLDFVCLNSGLLDIEYLSDESSISPRYMWLPRWGLRYFYLKNLFRWAWRLYLRSELGPRAKQLLIGYNLLIVAKKG